MKNIAIFCDGTWQDFSQGRATNVSRLARAVSASQAVGAAAGAEARPQVVRYDDGVGVGQGAFNTLTRFAGGAFGKGLDYKIARAYEFICLNYDPGDRLFLFGFSRGAYTVRSLAGLLSHFWILRRDESHRVHDIASLYRDRPPEDASQIDKVRWTDDAKHQRELWSHPIDSLFTDKKKYNSDDPTSLAPGSPKDCAWIQFLGVWDTVGSLGIPGNMPFADELDSKYKFHDTRLSSFVRSARQALSLDERRETFKPALWENVPDLNENAGGENLEYGRRPYQQQWFPGGHGSVGGGGASPISFPPLLWIAEGAARAGLNLNPASMSYFSGKADPEAEFDPEQFDVGGFIMKTVAGMKWRQGPATMEEVSVSARIRWLRSNYRPKSLEQLKGPLGDWTPPARTISWFNP